MQARNVRAAPAPMPAIAGPQFFPKNFASPETMPTVGGVPSLEYLASPTPSRISDAAAPPPPRPRGPLTNAPFGAPPRA